MPYGDKTPTVSELQVEVSRLRAELQQAAKALKASQARDERSAALERALTEAAAAIASAAGRTWDGRPETVVAWCRELAQRAAPR